MVDKKIVIICTIIGLGIITAIVGINITRWNKNFYTNTENQNNENTTINDNSNTTDVQNTTNEVETNETNEIQSNVLGEEEQTSSSSEKDESDTAISLAKKEWGENDETVYYTVDNSSGNIYTISVRSKSTTTQLAEYEVDLSSNKVTIK